MNQYSLMLYSREECCLCKALESKINELDLSTLEPKVDFLVIDIDDKQLDAKIYQQYTYEVPVLVLKENRSQDKKIKLPRVPPRLKNESLLFWLQKILTQLI